jgi:hypothetical protein
MDVDFYINKETDSFGDVGLDANIVISQVTDKWVSKPRD